MCNAAPESPGVEIRTRVMENRDNEHGEGGREGEECRRGIREMVAGEG